MIAATKMQVIAIMKEIRVVKVTMPVRREVMMAIMAMPMGHIYYRVVIAVMTPVVMISIGRVIAMMRVAIAMISMLIMTIIVVAVVMVAMVIVPLLTVSAVLIAVLAFTMTLPAVCITALIAPIVSASSVMTGVSIIIVRTRLPPLIAMA